MTLSHLTTLARQAYKRVNQVRIAGAAVKGNLHPFFRYLENRGISELIAKVRSHN